MADVFTEPFPVGAKIRRRDLTKDNPNYHHVYHIRGYVDGRAVVRTWVKRKQYWSYQVMNEIELEYYERVR